MTATLTNNWLCAAGYSTVGEVANYAIPICDITTKAIQASCGQSAVDYGHSLLSIKENVNALSASTLDVTFNNYDGFFDHVGTGQLSTLAVGSRLNLFLGYDIERIIDPTTSSPYGKQYQEYQRYFVDSWSYSRSPNLKEFTIHCIDAWGLLEKYRFNRRVCFNYYGATTTYSVYEIIEMLCQSVGGSLSYISRSSYITTFKPLIDVAAGDTAANLLRRLLAVVPDVIRFTGNDGYVVYPQSTEEPSYTFKFPVI
jgi:hypothetical protein